MKITTAQKRVLELIKKQTGKDFSVGCIAVKRSALSVPIDCQFCEAYYNGELRDVEDVGIKTGTYRIEGGGSMKLSIILL